MVIQWAKGSVYPWRRLEKVEQVKKTIKRINFEVKHILRSANEEADKRTKEGVGWIVM